MKRIQHLWRHLWTSLWFLPSLLVLAAVLLAIFLIDLDSRLDAAIWLAWPRLFGAGAAGSRGMLEVIATSMITVAGVVFSITIAALVQRTITQDAAFGVRQIVDVANKALSPGINDTTTAVLCMEHLTAILVKLAQRHIESPYRYEGDELRVIAIGPDFANLLALACDEIRRNAAGNVTVLTTLAAALALLADVTRQPARRTALLGQVRALLEVVDRTVAAPEERSVLERQCLALMHVLDGSFRRR